MKPIIEELDIYLNSTSLAKRTKIKYKQHLTSFANYLSNLIQEPLEQVNLSKIYCIVVNESSAEYIFTQIDAPILDKYFEINISRGYSWLSFAKSSISSLLKYLSLTYDFQNPIYNIEFRLQDHKQEPKNRHILNRQEILKLVMSIVENSKHVERDCLLFITLLSTGCRLGEVQNLKLRDIRTEDNIFFLGKTKNKRSKYVVTKIGLTKAMDIYCSKNKKGPEDYIFTDVKENKPISQSTIRRLLNYYLEKKNITATHLHGLRNSFVNVMYENGTDIDIIRQLINHETINSTKIYMEGGTVLNETIHIPIYESIFLDMRKLRSGMQRSH